MLEGTEEDQGHISFKAVGLQDKVRTLDLPNTKYESWELVCSFRKKNVKLDIRIFCDVTCSGLVASLLGCNVFWGSSKSSGK